MPPRTTGCVQARAIKVWEDIADIEARLDDAERSARQLPHREKYLLLVVAFLRRLLELHSDLVADVERELGDSR